MESVEAKSHGEVPSEVHANEEEGISQAGNDAWNSIGNILRSHVGADAFQRWFNAATWSGVDAGVATITVPGEVHQVWIETNYLPELTLAVSEVCQDVHEVKVALVDDRFETIGQAWLKWRNEEELLITYSLLS